MTVWLITGASRGFGLEIVKGAIARGDRVAATARRPDDLHGVLPDAGDAMLALPLDVTSPEPAEHAVQETVERFGRIDVLVNNAGRGLLGAVEEVSDAEARAAFDVNVFGLLTVTRAVLPILRQQRAGKIINISSSGGSSDAPGGASTARPSSPSKGSPRACATNSNQSGSRPPRSSPAAFAPTSSTTAASSPRPARSMTTRRRPARPGTGHGTPTTRSQAIPPRRHRSSSIWREDPI
jgi:NAD(P)-dependent dehydrogenase (short-subunit alcohol dehydrogenase family)